MNMIFNVKMLDKYETTMPYIVESMEDFVNHLDKSIYNLYIVEHKNCVEVKAESKDKDSLSLIFDSKLFDKSNILNLTNSVAVWLKYHPKNFRWEYQDCYDTNFDYLPLLTKDNTEAVYNLRQELVDSIRNKEDRFININEPTKQSIINNEYEALSMYNIQEQFMQAIYGATTFVKKAPLLKSDKDLFDELTPLEKRIMSAVPKTIVPIHRDIKPILEINKIQSVKLFDNSKKKSRANKDTNLVKCQKTLDEYTIR